MEIVDEGRLVTGSNDCNDDEGVGNTPTNTTTSTTSMNDMDQLDSSIHSIGYIQLLIPYVLVCRFLQKVDRISKGEIQVISCV